MAPMLYLQDKSSDFANGIEEDNWDDHAADKLSDAMQGLDERSQHIIRARWLDDENKTTLQELADQYGYFVSRIGTTGGDRLEISVYHEPFISAPLEDLRKPWATALEATLHGEVMA